MDKTKKVVHDFLSKSGHHDTTVHESVAPAVTHSVAKPTEHHEVNTAVQKEVHQDHHHQTVQPIHDREVLPEKHEHHVAPVEKRVHDHRDHEHTKHQLNTEAQQFQDKHVVTDTTHTQSHAPVAHGEHVHHHVHETIQPVLHKEVIQPSVVHTTVPVHEVHHNATQHHGTSSLPPVMLDEYKKQGGVLGGRAEHQTGVHSGVGDHQSHQGHDAGTHHSHGAADTTTHKKPSLMDKLNPMKDSDGDGKKGFMK